MKIVKNLNNLEWKRFAYQPTSWFFAHGELIAKWRWVHNDLLCKHFVKQFKMYQ